MFLLAETAGITFNRSITNPDTEWKYIRGTDTYITRSQIYNNAPYKYDYGSFYQVTYEEVIEELKRIIHEKSI